MTVEQDALRKNFLEPEVRCETYISAERKAAWKAILDILEAFIGICERHNLRWAIDAGSLLGAVRHKGIIPWDDDIDVDMPREDYDKIQDILPVELPDYYFMQSSRTDPEYPITHLKIRDSRTTGIDPYHAGRKMRFNMGIFMDIFPVDGCPDDPKVQRAIEAKELRLRKIRRNAYVHICKTPWDWMKHIYGWTFFKLIGNERIYRMREDLFRKHSLQSCKMCTTAPSQLGYRPRATWPTECFASYVDLPFEYLTVKAPVGYLKILETTYGDWHKFVKDDHQHNGLILDATRCYKDVLIEQFGYSRKAFRR